ncbi:hypothetical protein AVEN_34815-1 [Araneus ventricosus]|uniref:Uncharacterized protein n=1 Tax=Araneus ventricosus TaxID=182803 RepID=A0A4Y2MAH4_ARAVE|nr:hypothetical protein AVEN_34815-1 [Araneus ventricosus]
MIHSSLSVLPESETKFEPPKRFFTALPFSIQHSVFIPYLKGWSSAFLPLHWLIVLPGDQRLPFSVPSGQTPTVGKVLGFCHHQAIQG